MRLSPPDGAGYLNSCMWSSADVQFLSRGQSFLRYAGQSVEMDCEFYAEALDMFQHHIIWYKSQRQQQQQQQHRTFDSGLEGGKPGERESRREGEGRGSEGWIGGKQRGRDVWPEEGGQAGVGLPAGRRDRRRGGGEREGGVWEGKRWVREEEDVWSEGDDRMQVNLMGSLLEPFASTGRYRVNLSQQPPTYRLRLILTGARSLLIGLNGDI